MMAMAGAQAQTVVKTENWDSSTTLSTYTTAGWAFQDSANSSVQTTIFNSTPNAYKWASSTSATNYVRWTTAQDGNSGDVVVEANFYVDTTGNRSAGVFARANGDPVSTSTNLYRAFFTQNSGLLLNKRVSTTTTQIGSTVGANNTFTTLGWYKIRMRILGTSIAVVAQRLSDNAYLNSSGAWVTAKVDAISTTDSGISGQGYGGLYFQNTASANNYYSDDFSLIRYGDQAATGVTITPNTDAIFAGQTKGYLASLSPAYSSIGSDVAIALSTNATGSFSGTSGTLRTFDNNFGFTYTPGSTATGTHVLTATATGGLTTTGTSTLTVTYQPVTATVTVSATNTNDTQIQIVASAPVGGSGTGYTYQWKEATTAAGTYSNISGATSTTLTRTAAQMGNVTTPRFYQVVVTDSVSNTGTSRLVGVGLTETPIKIGIIGDSILALDSVIVPSTVQSYWSTGTQMARHIRDMLSPRPVTSVNTAQSGTFSSQWDSTLFASYNTGGSYTGCTHFIIMLGMNDGVNGGTESGAHTASQYQGYMISLINQIQVVFPSAKILVVPPYAPANVVGGFANTAQAIDRIVTYQTVISAIVSGCTTPANVRSGNVNTMRAFMINQDNAFLIADGVHPQNTSAVETGSGVTNTSTGSGGETGGQTVLSKMIANSFVQAFFDTFAPGGGSVVRRIQGQ